MSDLLNLYKQNPFIYGEIFTDNHYKVDYQEISGNIVLDIGAHFGFFSILCLLYGAKKVYAFEMDDDNYFQCIKNLEPFNLNKYKIYPYAITNKHDQYVYYENKNCWCNIVDQKTQKRAYSKNLNNVIFEIENSTNIILKLDVEGSEYDILYDLSPQNLSKIKIIYIEIHGEKQKRLALREYLKDHGFEEISVNQLFIDGIEGNTEINKYIRKI